MTDLLPDVVIAACDALLLAAVGEVVFPSCSTGWAADGEVFSPSCSRGWTAGAVVLAVVTVEITAGAGAGGGAGAAAMRATVVASRRGWLVLLPGVHLPRMSLLLIATTTIVVAPT